MVVQFNGRSWQFSVQQVCLKPVGESLFKGHTHTKRQIGFCFFHK